MNFKDALAVLAIVGISLGVISLLVWWEMYKYSDCRHVGHSVLYCVAAGGR